MDINNSRTGKDVHDETSHIEALGAQWIYSSKIIWWNFFISKDPISTVQVVLDQSYATMN